MRYRFMKRWLAVLLLLDLFVITKVNGQNITEQSSRKEIKEFLKNKRADEVSFCDSHKDVYFVRSKKTGKWGMYDWYGELVPMEYDTIQHFELFQPFTLGKKDGQYVVIQWPYDTEGEGVKPIIGYEGVIVEVRKGTKVSSASYFLVASKNGKWGCLDWKTLKEIAPFKSSAPDQVPIDSL